MDNQDAFIKLMLELRQLIQNETGFSVNVKLILAENAPLQKEKVVLIE